MQKISEIVFDIETDDLDASRVWCIVAKEVDGEVYKFGPNEIEDALNFLLQADALIGHNIIGFDLPVLKKLHNFNYTGKIIDTLVMSRLYNPI